MPLSEIVKIFRREFMIPMDQLAADSGLSKAYISMIENNKNPRTGKPIVPSIDTLRKLASGMRMDLDTLLAVMDGNQPVRVAFSSIYKNRHAEVSYEKGTDADDDTVYGHTVPAVRIPVLGRVAAGIPIDAIEEIIDYEEITDDMAKTGEYFGLLIRGDSMEPKISNGDVVIVKKQDDADDGDLVIAIVNGNEGCCKRIKKYDDGTIALVSTNPAYSPMFFTASEQTETPVRIVGKVKELRAKF